VDSTHKFAIRLIETKKARECAIVAENQTNGVGRCERPWTSVRGNLFASIIKKLPDQELGKLSLTVACAIHAAILKYIPKDLHLHWPNDVHYKKSKVSGILIAIVDDWMVISVGVNVNAAPYVADATSIAEVCGVKFISTKEVLKNILVSLEDWFNNLVVLGFSCVKNYWLRYINEMDCKVTIRNGSDSLTGVFGGIDDSGRLILKKDGRNLLVSSGDMFLNMEGIKVCYE
jgi:BirA family biotin operon repressor/biotin-[acetyl-CoA-carboxylase] ligase